ncbi:MAG: peptidoglycan-binding protein [Acidimicrobiia bacterium]|nr:peptidoglycan-binding protein [Acidimicrobiia bacterium]
MPAYRDLSAGVSDGPDVQELKQNLVSLGFDPSRQITINQTFDAATSAAVEAWQGSLGQSQTGVVKLGQVVFLPGVQRVTAIDTTLGSTGASGGSGGSGSGGSGSGGSGGSGSGGSGGSGSGGSNTPASTSVRPGSEFVSFTTDSVKQDAVGRGAAGKDALASEGAGQLLAPRCGSGSSSTASGTTTSPNHPTTPGRGCPPPTKPSSNRSSSPTAQQLLAQLVAELKRLASSSGGSGGRAAGASSAASATRGAGGSASGGSTGASLGSSGSSSGTATATPVMSTTSNQVVVSVQLDATKQSEAVVGEPVTVQLPDGSTVDGRITHVSPVAQSSTASGSSGAAGSSAPSATIPVTIALGRAAKVAGLDQAAVSVNFEQQVERNVLSVPVTALLATAGGGYAIQEASPPHRLIPVTPGLFAAGYVQISGSELIEGLQVTDSQG